MIQNKTPLPQYLHRALFKANWLLKLFLSLLKLLHHNQCREVYFAKAIGFNSKFPH